MTNFDFLLKEKKFESFANIAVSAEKIFNIDMEACAINCRKAMEIAIKWIYSVDRILDKPYRDNLQTLMNSEEFRDIIDSDLYKRMDFIRIVGNNAAHNNKKVSEEQVKLSLENLFVFMDFVAYCYADSYEERKYDPSLLERKEEEKIKKEFADIDLEKLLKENEELRKQLSIQGEEKRETYTPKSLDLSEFKTRKIYIDTMLSDVGWVKGKDWIDEVEVKGMPNKGGVGYIDYVLYDDANVPLAIIEAKKLCKDPSAGRQQAKLYADILQKEYGRRPVVFLTNGFKTYIDDGEYQEREVSFIYSKRDLEKLFNLKLTKESLKYIKIDKNIAGRYYQEGAVKAVCDAFEKKRRKALLVMATGSGKTRTVISLCDVLLRKGWVKNILFLADRNSLVTQAKRSFVNLLPNLSVTNLCEDKGNYSAHCVFSTYQTMINVIDSVRDEKGRMFSCGHFDLVICDEAHRSIYNKYKEIFEYFDAPLVGLTATPKDEVGKNTYDIFGLENGVPTYGYELGQAVKDGYLVDYITIETKLKLMEEGISYNELDEEEREEYENTFKNEDGTIPLHIDSSKLNSFVFNEDTIKQVLNTLMTDGLKIDYGEKIGKSIIFAKNHKHAEKILEVFNKEYPHLKGYACVIDNYTNYAQSAIDEFATLSKLPMIAISVDMLDTGIDVPEILNLVFFKKVMSKAKFWQMIGRGTRLCEGLIDGEDKKNFYIFDFCSNFEFFSMGGENKEAGEVKTLQSSIFNLEFNLCYKLQDSVYQNDEMREFRDKLVDDLIRKVGRLNKDNFAVRKHIQIVEKYLIKESYNLIDFRELEEVKEELSPLILPDEDDPRAVRFDALIYMVELSVLEGNKYTRGISDIEKRAGALKKVTTIPEVMDNIDIINKASSRERLNNMDIEGLEEIRKALRDLMKYIPKSKKNIYTTHFDDDILSKQVNASSFSDDGLENYKEKAEFYIRNHMDEEVIKKIKNNRPLGSEDMKKLEDILWNKIGSKDDYMGEFGGKPLGEFVRQIVGLDMNAAKEAFSGYLSRNNLNSNQIYFVNQVIEYIVKNGVMKDFSVMTQSPFNDAGSVADLFESDMTVWNSLLGVIKEINKNAGV